MSSNKPNVVIFFTDQQRWDTSSLFGNKMDLTPNFDRMAYEGTHCANAFTPQPVCLPARSCLQTGKYASTMNIFNNAGALPDDAMTLGHYFKDAGYRTGYIGKWHMCNGRDIVPKEKRQGYDDWLGVNLLEFTSDSYRTVLYDDNGDEVFLPGYRVDAVTDEAIRYIDKNKENPFFLMVSYLEPHFQNHRDDYPAPDGYEQKYINPWTPPDLVALGGTSAGHLPGYYGMVKRLDEAFGRLRDAIKSLELEDNTIVLFTSDHGCHFKTRNSEYKRSCHDSSVRIPMAFTGPGFEYGGRLPHMVSLIDIAPTLLSACNIKIPDGMDGKPITKLVNRQDDNWPDHVFIEICNEEILRRCVRTKRWKYSVKAQDSIKDNDGNALVYVEEEFYDLMADPWELNNLVGYESHRKVSDIMKERLLKHMNELGESPKIVDAPERDSAVRKVFPKEIYN